MTSGEQERIELVAPSYLKHIIVIMTEMGLRPQRELLPMLKSRIDLENRLVHISDSKTSTGIGDMPMTDLAYAAFKEQVQEAVGSEYLFPGSLTVAAGLTSAASRRRGERRYGVLAFRISRYTSCVTRSLPD